MKAKRLRRCQLSVPGSSEKMLAKAATLDVDYVFMDLEDAVAPSEKRPARQKIVQALNNNDWGRTVRAVRINDPSTEYFYEDIVEVVTGAGHNLDVIMIPKVMDRDDVVFVDRLLSALEHKLGIKHRIGIDVLIEEVQALHNVDRIAGASPRLEALIFGMGDYSASQGVSVKEIGGGGGYPGDIWHYQRHRIVIAAKCNGLDAVDGPFADFSAPESYQTECRKAMVLGMVGKWAIHPSQVPYAHQVFSPSQEEVDKARGMKEAYNAALAQGLGAVQYEGKMIDIASVRLVQNILDKADLIGM